MSMTETPRIMLAGTTSGAGKTVVTCGLLSCLLKRGKKVTGFKCGPDYIDAMYHSRVLGVETGNLDSYFCDEETLKELLILHGKDYDINIIEGVMGYFDGIGMKIKASSADTARLTKTPAILIIPCKGVSNSVSAIVKGFKEYEEEAFGKEACLRGVIFNQLAPHLYEELAEEARKVGLRPLGYVPYEGRTVLECRHLGLLTAGEVKNFKKMWDDLGTIMEKTVDIDGILEIASKAPALRVTEKKKEENVFEMSAENKRESLKIGVTKDEAFCFLYRDNITFLERMGCEICYFSPLHDKELPEDISALYLSGGYPELHGKVLEKNTDMRKAIRRAFIEGVPLIAECGGFLYLHDSLESDFKKMYDMVGILPGRAFHRDRFPGQVFRKFGYIEMQAMENNLLCNKGETLKAHEFHYWESEEPGEAFHCVKPGDGRSWNAGFVTPYFYAGFPHIYFYGNKKAGKRFVEEAAAWKRKKEMGNCYIE